MSIVLEKLENKNLEDADKKLEHYREKFRRKEESGRIIVSNVKRINRDFLRRLKLPTFIKKIKNDLSQTEIMYLAAGNEKNIRFLKGWQGLQFMKKI